MNRRIATASRAVLGLALAAAVASCATSAPRSTGKFLKMVNDTAVIVTMKACPAASLAQAQGCSEAVRVAPSGSAKFQLGKPGSAARQVVITGYGGQTVCFMVPDTGLRLAPGAYATADVAKVLPGSCIGPYGGS